MREHERFGAPPKLRPRTAGASRSALPPSGLSFSRPPSAAASASALAPEQLASIVNASQDSASLLLRQRLQSPRPGSAAPQQTPRAPIAAATITSDKGVFMKPPMRPKSATSGSHHVSRHRMKLLQEAAPPIHSDNQTERASIAVNDAPATVGVFTAKEHALRPSSGPTSRRDHTISSSASSKRPFSACIVSATTRPIFRPEPPATSKQSGVVPTNTSSAKDLSRGIKRPHSAAPGLLGHYRTRDSSTDSLGASCFIKSYSGAALRSGLTARFHSGQSQGNRLAASTQEKQDIEHLNTFVYAVPRHFLDPGLAYDPYDITTLTHQALFGDSASINQIQEAKWDYYTISRAGYTFHAKADAFRSTFLSVEAWEAQKAQFTKLRSLSTFSGFRYRKVFLAWKQWVRASKCEAARENLIEDCYFSHPALLHGMQRVHLELAKLAEMRLLWDFGGQTVSLAHFTTTNTRFVRARTKELQEINMRIQAILAHVCRVFLDDNAPLHGGFPGHEFALSVRKSSNFHIFQNYVEREQKLASADHQLVQHEHFRSSAPPASSQSAQARAGQLHSNLLARLQRLAKQRHHHSAPREELDEIRWTMAAIRRRKCRQLTKFATLVDFLLLDAYTRVVKRSIDLLHNLLLRGANAATVLRLTDREDLSSAMHSTLDTLRKSSLEAITEGGMTNSVGNHSRAAPEHRLSLTRQQIKSFLRTAWGDKLPAPSPVSVSTSAAEATAQAEGTSGPMSPPSSSSTTIWMESKLEALFFEALNNHVGKGTEVYSAEELLFVAESTLSQLVMLPPFYVVKDSIFDVPLETADAKQVPDGQAGEATDFQVTLASAEADVLTIPCLRPVPLFSLDLITANKSGSRPRDYEVAFEPELAGVVQVLQSTIVGFTEAFRQVSPLLSSPDLCAVLDFADDIRSLQVSSALRFGVAPRSRAPSASSSRHSHGMRALSELMTSNRRDEDEDNGDNNEERRRCPADRLMERMQQNMAYLSVREEIEDLTGSALHGAMAFAACYSEVLELRRKNEAVDFELKAHQFRKSEYSLQEMMDDAVQFNDQLNALRMLKISESVEFLRFEMQQLQADLLPSPTRCLDALRELLPLLVREKCDRFLDYIHVSTKKLQKPVIQDLDAFVTYLLHLQEVYDEILDRECDLAFLHDFFRVLEKLKFTVPLDTTRAFELCEPEFQALKAHVQEAHANRDSDLHSYSPMLTGCITELGSRITELQSDVNDQAVAALSNSCGDARDTAVKLKRCAEKMQKEAARLVRIQRVFDEASSDSRPLCNTFEDLNALSVELKLKSELWEAVCQADEYLHACSIETLRSIELEKMSELASHVDAVVERVRHHSSQVARGFELERLEKLQVTLHGLAPVIRDLRNPHLASRHWSKLEYKMQCSLAPPSAVTDETEPLGDTEPLEKNGSLALDYLELPVQHLLTVDAVAHTTTIRHVSEEATAEAAVEASFATIVRTWELKQIPVEAKKDRDGRDVYCIGDCVELASLVEESQVLLRVMDSSTYTRMIQERLPDMLNDLTHTKDSLELLQVCQRKWDHTQRLLSADFARCFPEQAKQLYKHDSAWRMLTLTLYKRPLCLPFGVSTEQRQTLQTILEGFEVAAKSLADHLEIKRQVFPAFFQLSDFELATLLSKARDVSCIQPFLFQCFDNVGRIVFGTRESFQDILQITSRAYDGAEVVPMGKNLKARGPPEQWLSAVEKRLSEQLRKSTKQAVEIIASCDKVDAGRSSEMINFEIFRSPVQTVFLADRIMRCEIIDSGVRGISEGSPATNHCPEEVSRRLAVYSRNLVESLLPPPQARGSGKHETLKLHPREIALLAGLRLQELQFRDALTSHVNWQKRSPLRRHQITRGSSVPGNLAVSWDLQLKYRLDDATTVGHECHVEMNGLRIPYGFNYVNPSSDSVITPSSLRSLFSLFACIRHAQGCALVGGDGSGKRTLGIQVSSLLGRRSFTSTLSSYTHATRLLIGALNAGGTFNAQVQVHTLSATTTTLIKTLATTLAAVEHAMLTQNAVEGLHVLPIKFLPGTAMLLSLIGTVNVPDRSAEDLRVWTESLCQFVIVQWDWACILEALLYSRGFAEPHTLAKQLWVVQQQVLACWGSKASTALASDPPGFTFSVLKSAIAEAADQHHPDLLLKGTHTTRMTLQDQKRLLRDALLRYFCDRIDPEYFHALECTLTATFYMDEHPDKQFAFDVAGSKELEKKQAPHRLHEFLVDAARELQFVARRALLDSALTLADALAASNSVILVGSSGMGKSTAYQVLAKAIELCVRRREEELTTELGLNGGPSSTSSVSTTNTSQPPSSMRAMPATLASRNSSTSVTTTEKAAPKSVAVRIVLPMALTVTQLYGGVSPDGHGRIPCILGRLFREAQERYLPPPGLEVAADGVCTRLESGTSDPLVGLHNQLWVVFDGALDLRWIEGLLAVLNKPGKVVAPLLSFLDGEFMTRPPNLRFLFEVLQLRNATPSFLHQSSIVSFGVQERVVPSQAVKKHRGRWQEECISRMDVSTAYLHRYFATQREEGRVQPHGASKHQASEHGRIFDVAQRWLLDSTLLAELTAILDAGHEGLIQLSPLQRVTNLTSLLQPLLSTTSSLPDVRPTSLSGSDTKKEGEAGGGSDLKVFPADLSTTHIRVEMALIYSLLWGFAACSGGQELLQRQLSDVLRREFEHLTSAWEACGADVNLFETLIDLHGLRFVPVSLGAGYIVPPLILSSGDSRAGLRTLFVPTPTSLLVHAVAKEALRSGKGVLLLGGTGSRRTTLMRNFLGQLHVLRSVVSSVRKSPSSHNDDDSDTVARTETQSVNPEAETLASVKRVRLRQVTLMTVLAARLRKTAGDDESSSSSASEYTPHVQEASTAGLLSTLLTREEKEALPPIMPMLDAARATMVHQFDRGEVIPFFFAMGQGGRASDDGGVTSELARCLERMLQRERTGVFEPPPGKTALLILDDLHISETGANARAAGQCTTSHPSCHAYLRSVYEHGSVYNGEGCAPVSIENLMLLVSMRVEHYGLALKTAVNELRDESLHKLTTQFFPVLSPTCSLQELHHVFSGALQAHWVTTGESTTSDSTGGRAGLTPAVRHALPLVIAATTVLWDRLRASYRFSLHDLARVYEGLAGVTPSFLGDVETLLRLWTHESIRVFHEPAMGICSQDQTQIVTEEIKRMHSLLLQVSQRRASARASRMTLGPGPSLGAGGGSRVNATTKRPSSLTPPTNSDETESISTYLALFSMRSERAAAGPSNTALATLRSPRGCQSDQEDRTMAAGGLWALVPASIYYRSDATASSIVAPSSGGNNDSAGDAVVSTRRLQRRNSASFMRRKSMQSVLGGCGSLSRTNSVNSNDSGANRWVYVEISFEDDSELVATAAVQVYYGSLRSFSTTTNPHASLQRVHTLPRDVPPVPFALAQTVATIDRVLARPGARLVLVGSPNSGADALLRFASASRTVVAPLAQLEGGILTLCGVPDDPGTATSATHVLGAQWRRLLHDIYERVGVAGQEVTLIVKHVDLLPVSVVVQLQALMATGEVPGALSLEEQVQLATRVYDERLLALQAKHAELVVQLKLAAKSGRDKALAILKQQQRDSLVAPSAEAYQAVELHYQKDLRSKLARAELRWQQDSEDLRRAREVESESVAATVMALTRPLGVTSGKWASAVARVRSKLRVALLVDPRREARVRAASPGVFTMCDSVSLSELNRHGLRTLVYGHFHAQLQQLGSENGGSGPRDPTTKGLVEFLQQVERDLWTLVCMATDMHLSVVNTVNAEPGEHDPPPVSRTFAMASYFSKLLVENYKREEGVRAKAAWFLDLSERLERDLGTLRSSDGQITEELAAVDQQMEAYEARLAEQHQDADRIRAIMLRFQTAAEEQVLVTNEAQELAQRELREPMACLEEANRALLLVDRRHIVEIKSFVNPPPLVHLVLGAVCVLFQLEPSWESARRLLLGDANVVQTLLHFEKDAVPPGTLARLESEFLRDERFRREEVERQSVAAASMVGWVRAIHMYAVARLQVQPTLDKLEKAQGRLTLLMEEFQVSKKRVVEADEACQATQTALDAAQTRKQALKTDMDSLATRCDSGGLAVEALQEDRQRQRDVVDASAMRRGFALPSWNALLSGGALAYACELKLSTRRNAVFRAWEAAYWCYGGLASGCPPASTKCTFVPSIAVEMKDTTNLDEEDGRGEPDEHANGDRNMALAALFVGDYLADGSWRVEETTKLVTGMAAVAFSRRSILDVTLLSLVASTPALSVVMITHFTRDLEEILVTCARSVWHWNHLLMVHTRAPDFDEVFRTAVRDGHQLMVLDVEPLDVERCASGVRSDPSYLQAVLRWETLRVDGKDHLVVLREDFAPSNKEGGSNAATSTTTSGTYETMPLHPNFRLILTSHASRAAFGEALDLVPTLDAPYDASDVVDVILDKLWASPMQGSRAVEDDGAGFKLKALLREHDQLVCRYDATQAQLIKLLEAAVVGGEFQLTQTQALCERCAVAQELRKALREKRREIRAHLRVVRSQALGLAQAGAAVFNAFNTTVADAEREWSSPPLTLQLFLPMFYESVTPASPAAVATLALMPKSPASMPNDLKRQVSARRNGMVARAASSFMLAASSRRHSGVLLNAMSEMLTQLLTRLAPLIPLSSSKAVWHRFLLQMFLALETMKDTEVKPSTPTLVDERPGVPIEYSMRSVDTVLLQSKLSGGDYKRRTLEAFIDADRCKELLQSGDLRTRSERQQCVVQMIVSGTEASVGSLDTAHLGPMVVAVLSAAPSRSERLRVGLSLFPELVGTVCDRLLALYGVRFKFEKQDESGDDLKAAGSTGTDAVGSWLRAMRALPEETAVVVLSRHDFHSFGFARRVFFQSVARSNVLQIRVLQKLFARKFQDDVDEGEVASAAVVMPLADDNDQELIPLTQLYVLPRSVPVPSEELAQEYDLHHEEPHQLLLMASAFGEIAEMEQTQLGVLEAAPLALINMQQGTVSSVHWEALVQILHRSCQQTSSIAFRRHKDTESSVGCGGLVKQRSATENGGAGAIGSTASLQTTTTSLEAAAASSRTLVKQHNPMQRRRSSSQSLVHRHSAIELVTPVYPRLVAVVDDWRTLPIHLLESVLCFQDEGDWGGEDAWTAGQGDGAHTPPSFQKCLQYVLLRFALYPCASSLSTAAQSLMAYDVLQTDPSPTAELWLLLTGLLLFHSTLIFRAETLGAAYQGALPSAKATGSFNMAFRYGDDAFLTAVNQLLAVLTDKPRSSHHSQQRRRTARANNHREALEHRLQQQVVLGVYSRLAAGFQEVERLEQLFHECLLAVGWHLEVAVENLDPSSKPVPPTLRTRNRQMTLRDHLQSSRTLELNPAGLAQQHSMPFMARSGSSRGTPLLLAFLAVPTETLQRSVSSVNQWLELMWNHSAVLNRQTDAKLQAVLLGEPLASVLRRGSSQGSALDLLAAQSSGTSETSELASHSPPLWMRAFGWRSACLGRPADVAATVELRLAIDVLRAILSESLPSSIEKGAGYTCAPDGSSAEDVEVALKPEDALLKQIQSVILDAFNRQVSAFDRGLEATLLGLQACEDSEVAAALDDNKLEEPQEEDAEDGEDEGEDQDQDYGVPDEEQRKTLADVPDPDVKQQAVAVLRNEIPPALRLAASTPPSWSLHDVLQHLQDWRSSLVQPSPTSGRWLSRWYLPGLLVCDLSVAHVLELAQMRCYAANPGISERLAVQYTLRCSQEKWGSECETENDKEEPSNESANADPPVLQPPELTFAILDGLVLLGAAWDDEMQCLDRKNQHQLGQRVELVCYLRVVETEADMESVKLQNVPLVGSYGNVLLLECVLSSCARLGALATPVLAPVGPGYR